MLTYCQDCEIPIVVFFSGDYFDKKMMFCLTMSWDVWIKEAGEKSAFSTVLSAIREEFGIPDEIYIGICADEIKEFENDDAKVISDFDDSQKELGPITDSDITSFIESELGQLNNPKNWDGKRPWD